MRTTEQPSNYDRLESMSTDELLTNINREDKTVAEVIGEIIPSISMVVDEIYNRMKEGGRLFYIGSGTSGRLGVVDASECPPTFGVPHGLVIGVISGGDPAIRKAAEFAEDDPDQGWKDLLAFNINPQDFLIGIAASGTTPYVLGAIDNARKQGIGTAGITSNAGAPLSEKSEFPIVAVVGPEFVTGSTRMKSGTAQKLILNMISTSVMVKLGHVQGNRMVDMKLSNKKLVERGTLMIIEQTGLDFEVAKKLLLKEGSVRKAVEAFKK